MAFACIEDEHKLTLRKWDSVSGFTRHISVTSAIPHTATPGQTSQKQNIKLKLKHFPLILNHLKHTSLSRPPINVKHYVVVSEATCHGCSASRIQPSHLLSSAHQWHFQMTTLLKLHQYLDSSLEHIWLSVCNHS